ncbi:MAG: hypothetical protein ACRC3H_20900 [Lachnospiraceae bacterium]
MTDYDKIIRRANIQELRALFLEGVDPGSDCINPVTDNYEERIHKGERPLMEFIEKLYPDGNVRDAVFHLVCDALLVNQEVYTEIGMRLGAQAVFELLRCDPVKELYHGQDNKKG